MLPARDDDDDDIYIYIYIYIYMCVCVCVCVGSLVGFHGISHFVCYLMKNLFLYK